MPSIGKEVTMENTLEARTQSSSARYSRARNMLYALALSVSGCAGWSRSCSSWEAENFAADWAVAQFDAAGKPFNCWKLEDTSITNEPHSDGIYWKDSPSGHLVHISGWYNRVQVENGQWKTAAEAVGVELDKCTNGKYTP